MRKSTLWTLRKVSTRISLSMPHRRTRIYTFRLLWVFCFRNHYSIYSPLDVMCRPVQSARTAQADLVDTLRRCVSPQLHFGGIFRKNVLLVHLSWHQPVSRYANPTILSTKAGSHYYTFCLGPRMTWAGIEPAASRTRDGGSTITPPKRSPVYNCVCTLFSW